MTNIQNLTNFKEFVNAINTDSGAYEYAITTLTAIQDKVIKQKYYQVNIPSFVDIEAGKGAFNSKILHNVVYDLAGSFESGLINTGDGVRVDKTDVGITKIEFPILNWAKGCRYSYIDIQQCLVANNIDLVEQVIQSRKRNWDLGLQKTIFVGTDDGQLTGLANNAGVTSNTTFMSKKICTMTDAELQAFASGALDKFFANTNGTQMPNRFFIPAEDWNGLSTSASIYKPDYSRLKFLTDAFKAVVSGYGVNDFEILPLMYLNKDKMNQYTGVNKYRYILANKSADTYYAPIPVEFTMTQFGTADNFNFQNIAYGQIAGTVVLRPQEILYFDFA